MEKTGGSSPARGNHGRSSSVSGMSSIKRTQNYAAKAAAQRLAQVMASQSTFDDDDDNDNDGGDLRFNPPLPLSFSRPPPPSRPINNNKILRSSSDAVTGSLLDDALPARSTSTGRPSMSLRTAPPPSSRPSFKAPAPVPPVDPPSSRLSFKTPAPVPPVDTSTTRKREKKFSPDLGQLSLKDAGDGRAPSALRDELDMLQEENENILEKLRLAEESYEAAEARVKELEKQASKLFELHLYTMGNKYYATEMAKLLDPKGELFSGRVISRGGDGEPFDGDNDRAPKTKDLEGVLGMESGVIIVDDSVRVWPHNKLNLIVVERYIYFPCSRRQFGLPGPSLLEIDHDERPEEGTLASSLAVIEKIHQSFFAHKSLDEADVRNILASEQRRILSGCRILFSRVFPVGESKPHMHPLWQTAEQFGAVCTNQTDDQVTHVVANSLGTDKVNWALSSGRFVVHPGWVEASALLYRRANELDFAIKQQ